MANGSVVRIRKNVWSLAQWSPELLWYARAVVEMQSRPIKDPTSWRYQAAIHGYYRAMDPSASAADVLPSTAEQKRFWNQCQHSSWFFLPWHRIYLAYFEQIVAEAVVKLGGPGDWSLPYWNYSDSVNLNARNLPDAFWASTLPDKSPNPLNVAGRSAHVNGNLGITSLEVDLSCLTDKPFTNTVVGAPSGFGGPKTVFNHSGGPAGGIEKTPHGDIHIAVGGLMAAFETAGLDPIFWLHHANIDRLWEVWRARAPSSNIDPTDPDWLNGKGAAFEFHDALGAIQTQMPSQVVDTTKVLSGYTYDDISDPIARPAVKPFSAASASTSAQTAPAELLGATGSPLPLTSAATTARISLHKPKGPASRSLTFGGPAAPRKTYLNLEHITGAGNPGNYAVYLNVRAQDNAPERPDEQLAGTVPMFGVAEASRASSTSHAGSGLTYVLDVTDLVNRLKAQGQWDDAELRVTFHPLRSGAQDANVEVGRISLYFAA